MERHRFVALPTGSRLPWWLWEFESQQTSLCHAALADVEEPGSRYRLVKRMTGVQWTELQARGMVWLVEELVKQFHRPTGAVGALARGEVA